MNSNEQHVKKDMEKSIEEMKNLRHSSIVSMLLLLFGVIIIIGSFIYSITRLKPLENKARVYKVKLDSLDTVIEDKQATLKQLEDEIGKKQKLLNVVEESNAKTKRNEITINYFFKGVDSSLVLNAIKNLGFKYKAVQPTGTTQTNAIWYGSGVDIEYVKLIAYTLLNSGVKIQYIGPFKNSQGREYVIQLGGRPQDINDSPITSEQIKSMTR